MRSCSGLNCGRRGVCGLPATHSGSRVQHGEATMIDDEFRRYLADLYAEDDRMRAEHAEWMAERKALAQKSDDDGLLYRTHEENASLPGPEPELASDEDWCFSELQMESLAVVFNELRREWQQDIERAQRRIFDAMVRMGLPGELAEREVHDLRGRVIRAEQQIERRLKEAIGDDSVVDLPPGF